MLAIAVAGLIMWTAWRIVSRSTRVLLDEALPDDELAIVRATVAEHRGELIIGYHKLRARHAGSRHLIDLHITVPGDMTIAAAHRVAEHIETDIGRAAAPTPTCWCTSSRASHERERRVVGVTRGRGPLRRRSARGRLELTPSGRVEATSTTVSTISATEKAQATVL